METTFGDLKKKILRLCSDDVVEDSDPIGGATYGADILGDAVHAALDAICPRVWRSSVIEVDLDDDEIDLPGDVIDVETVYDKKLGIFLPRIQMQVGQVFGSTTGNAWYLFPYGTLKFINKVVDGATVFYSGRWTKPTDDDDTLEPPSSTEICLILYAASYCMIPDAVSSGSVRQFNTKVDSGTPLDIPAQKISDFLLGRFERELLRIPFGEKVRNQ